MYDLLLIFRYHGLRLRVDLLPVAVDEVAARDFGGDVGRIVDDVRELPHSPWKCERELAAWLCS